MNYAINFSCTNKEEASSEVWPESRWNATIKAVNTVFHLEALLRIRNNSCSDGSVWQRCCNVRVCRTLKKMKRQRRGWSHLKLFLGGRELIAFFSFFLLKSQVSQHYIYNYRLWAQTQSTRQLFFWGEKKDCCFLKDLHFMLFKIHVKRSKNVFCVWSCFCWWYNSFWSESKRMKDE